MIRFSRLTIAIALVVTAQFSANYKAQTSADSSSLPYKTRPLPPVETVIPFSGGASSASNANSIEFLSENQATDLDRKLAASVEPSIRESATLAGFEFDKGTWSHQQLACQALPDYLFLIFKGDNGASDLSIFSAAIWRSNTTHVRIIPIERRGYSLFSPAPVNPLTISAFNRIRANEPASKDADWLATALCYAALTGAHPEITQSRDATKNANLALSFPPTIEVQSYGQSTVRFVDVAATRQPMQWALTFDAKGRLLKVEHFATPAFAVTPIPRSPDQPPPAQSSQ